MAEGNVSFKLDLVVCLLDTTTGFVTQERQVMFYVNGCMLPMRRRGDGMYVLMNSTCEDMDMEITVKGYLSVKVPVRYSELDSKYPTIEVPLIPEVPAYGYTDICTLTGTMAGITDIAAISTKRTDALLGAYNPKKNTLRLFESRRLDEMCYAIFHKEKMEFEEFCIVNQTDKGMLLVLKDPLTEECSPGESIVRIVFGTVEAKDRYMLRIRQDQDGTQYLIRYTVDGETRFQVVDFGAHRERRLE